MNADNNRMLAVLEQRWGTGWRVIGAVSPDDPEIIITAPKIHAGGSIRLRFILNEDNENE